MINKPRRRPFQLDCVAAGNAGNGFNYDPSKDFHLKQYFEKLKKKELEQQKVSQRYKDKSQASLNHSSMLSLNQTQTYLHQDNQPRQRRQLSQHQQGIRPNRYIVHSVQKSQNQYSLPKIQREPQLPFKPISSEQLLEYLGSIIESVEYVQRQVKNQNVTRPHAKLKITTSQQTDKSFLQQNGAQVKNKKTQITSQNTRSKTQQDESSMNQMNARVKTDATSEEPDLTQVEQRSIAKTEKKQQRQVLEPIGSATKPQKPLQQCPPPEKTDQAAEKTQNTSGAQEQADYDQDFDQDDERHNTLNGRNDSQIRYETPKKEEQQDDKRPNSQQRHNETHPDDKSEAAQLIENDHEKLETPNKSKATIVYQVDYEEYESQNKIKTKEPFQVLEAQEQDALAAGPDAQETSIQVDIEKQQSQPNQNEPQLSKQVSGDQSRHEQGAASDDSNSLLASQHSQGGLKQIENHDLIDQSQQVNQSNDPNQKSQTQNGTQEISTKQEQEQAHTQVQEAPLDDAVARRGSADQAMEDEPSNTINRNQQDLTLSTVKEASPEKQKAGSQLDAIVENNQEFLHQSDQNEINEDGNQDTNKLQIEEAVSQHISQREEENQGDQTNEFLTIQIPEKPRNPLLANNIQTILEDNQENQETEKQESHRQSTIEAQRQGHQMNSNYQTNDLDRALIIRDPETQQMETELKTIKQEESPTRTIHLIDKQSIESPKGEAAELKTIVNQEQGIAEQQPIG